MLLAPDDTGLEAITGSQVVVKPTEGYLSIITYPGAEVTIRRITGSGKNTFLGSPIIKRADESTLAKFDKISPGQYEIKVTMSEDYVPIRESISVKTGKQTISTYNPIPRYATLILSMGAQAADDVDVLIDGQKFPAKVDSANGKCFIERIDRIVDGKLVVREREIVVRKPNHDDFVFKRLIKPAKCDNDVAVTLKRQVVTLTVEGVAGARIYLNKVDKGRIPADGRLVIPDLLPGEYSLSGELIGYRGMEQKVSLTPQVSEPKVALNLESLVETAEANLEFFDEKEKMEFYPSKPPSWNLNRGKRLTVAGGGVALMRSATYPDRDFAIYRDFTLTISVNMLNGNGAAWVARANGKGDYYLFEIKPEKSGGKAQVVFSASRCISNVCSQLNRLDLTSTYPGIVTNPSFRISLTASGNEFWHCIEEGTDLKPIGQVITDPSLERGGVGLYGGNGHEFHLFQFNVVPYNTCNKQCERITRPR